MKSFSFFNITSDDPIKINIDRTSEDYLYHYTTINGVLGILDKKCFWVTQSDFLNDSSEVLYLKDVIGEAHDHFNSNLDNYISKSDYEGNILKSILLRLQRLGEDFVRIKVSYDFNYFILSLSEYEDSLLLFSNYSNHDGYCLGLERKRILNANNCKDGSKKDTLMFEGRVNYNRENQVSIIVEETLEIYELLLHRLFEKKQNYIEADQAHTLINYVEEILHLKLMNYSMFFKNSAFNEEKEYRVVFLLGKNKSKDLIKYRINNSIIIPYAEIYFTDFPLSSITIGPKNKIDIAEKSLVHYLENNNYTNIEIRKSNIPLRY